MKLLQKGSARIDIFSGTVRIDIEDWTIKGQCINFILFYWCCRYIGNEENWKKRRPCEINSYKS